MSNNDDLPSAADVLTRDYSTIPLPEGDPSPDWTIDERRAYLLDQMIELGHPRRLNQSEAARQFDVHHSTIQYDLQQIAKEMADGNGRARDLFADVVFQKSIKALQDEGEHLSAARVTKMWIDFLQSAGITEREPERSEVTLSTEATETDAIKVVNVEGEELTDQRDW